VVGACVSLVPSPSSPKQYFFTALTNAGLRSMRVLDLMMSPQSLCGISHALLEAQSQILNKVPAADVAAF
jgi:hypothetical protein